MKFAAVLFDLDNTLLDRDRTFRRFCETFVASFFSGLPADRKRTIIEQIVIADRDGYRNKEDMFAELRDALPWSRKPEIAELMEYYRKHYVHSSTLMDSAVELLDRCRGRGLKLGMITNGSNAIQYGKIDKLGLRRHFDYIVVSEEAGVRKPDRRIFEMALSELNVRAEEAVFVGDHPVNDIQGAADVGMQTVWMIRSQPWDGRLSARPLKRIRHLQELFELLFSDGCG